jgi:serine/threonine protein kinase
VIWIGWLILPSCTIGILFLLLIGYYGTYLYGRWRTFRAEKILDKYPTQIISVTDNRLKEDLAIPSYLVIPYKEIQILRDNIANGADSVVSLGLWKKTYVMVKQYLSRAPDAVNFVREAKIHHTLRHPNIVQFLGICPDPLCTVTEFMPRGNLADFIRSPHYARKVNYSVLIGFALDCCRGMSFLHSREIIHRG